MRTDAIANLDAIDAIAKRYVPHRPTDWADRVAACRAAIERSATLGDTRAALRLLTMSAGDRHFSLVITSCGLGTALPERLDRFRADEAAARNASVPLVSVRQLIVDGDAAPIQAIERLLQGDGSPRCVILDLRLSDGGQLTVAAGIVGFFIDADTRLGEIVDGDTRIDLVARARPAEQRYRGKVAVLVDRDTISAAEVLATSLQRHAGARVFGEPTAGAASPSTVIQIANGDWLQHPVGRFEPGDVAPVRPDEVVSGEEAATRAMEWARGD